MLPKDFAPWNTVYFYYSKWKHEGLIEELNEVLRNYLRNKAGKEISPSVGIIDSRSVKTTRLGGQARGFDGGKTGYKPCTRLVTPAKAGIHCVKNQ